MPYHVAWLIPNRVIYARYSGEVDYKDIEETGAIFAGMIESGDSPVHLIPDTRLVTRSPRDVAKIVRHLRNYKRTDVGWVMSINANKAENFLATLILHVLSPALRLHMFESPEQIAEFLAARDERIPVSAFQDALKHMNESVP